MTVLMRWCCGRKQKKEEGRDRRGTLVRSPQASADDDERARNKLMKTTMGQRRSLTYDQDHLEATFVDYLRTLLQLLLCERQSFLQHQRRENVHDSMCTITVLFAVAIRPARPTTPPLREGATLASQRETSRTFLAPGRRRRRSSLWCNLSGGAKGKQMTNNTVMKAWGL